MHIRHNTKLGKGMTATHYDNFPTVELYDGEGTQYIPQQCWAKLIKVLQKAQAAHEAHTATINENNSD